MCGDEDDTLVRYHFGDLDRDQTRAVEARLAAEPDYAQRLEALRECLAADAADDPGADGDCPDDCPEDLADRTVRTVLSRAAGDAARCVGRKRFCLAEVAALGVVALLVGSMITPALQASRENSRRLACQNNLAELYRGLQLYSRDHRTFPQIGPGENAGLFAVSLADGDYLERESLHGWLVCPASDLAEQVAQRRAAVVVPTRAELEIASPLVLDRLEHLMAGSFAYRIGYYHRGRYEYPMDRADCRSALVADGPARDGVGAVVSRNHGGDGLNVLFQDGHVDFQTACWSPGLGDHLFLNDDNQIAAGRGPADVVLAPSEARPSGAVRVVRFRF